MKKSSLIYIVFLVLSVAGGSCKKFLDLKPESELTTGNAYSTAADLENALVGAYRAFYFEYYIWENVLLGDVRSDNAYSGGGGDLYVAPYDMLTIPVGNIRLYADWSQLYTGIARCNIIIDKMEAVDDPALDVDNRRGGIGGEAHFLRAFHYFQLVKSFGGVPLELHSNNTDPAVSNLQRSSEKEVYDQIVADLEIAVTSLPDDYGSDASVNKVRATKGAAYALLAKVWAQRSDRDYSKVLQYCQEVVNSAADYALVDDYASLFDGDHYYSAESILEVPFIGGNADVANWGPQLYLAPEDGWQKYCVPSKDLVAAYDASNDNIRKNANIVFYYNLDWPDLNWNPCQDPATGVPFNYKQKHADNWASGDHHYLLRFADILLLQAEAQNELGQTAAALSTLNKVRARVSLAPAGTGTQQELREKILLERRLELAFEGQRFDDLVRLNKIESVMNSLEEYNFSCTGSNPSDPERINYNMSADKRLLPIPQLERDANPNLSQNPGY